MFRLSFTCALLLVGISVFGLNVRLDSLMNRTEGLSRNVDYIETLLQIADEINKDEPAKAISYLDDAIFLSDSLNYQLGLMNAFRIKGASYLSLGNYEQALILSLKSLRIAQTLDNKDGQMRILNNTAVLYMYLDKEQDALDNYYKILELAGKDDVQHKQRAYVNLGIIFRQKKQYDTALSYYHQALKFSKKLNDYNAQGIIHHNMGNLFLERGDQDQAYSAFKKSLVYGKETNNSTVLSSSLMYIGKILSLQGNFESGEHQIHAGLKVAKEKGLVRVVLDGYEFLYEHYELKKDIINAVNYRNLHADLKDSLMNEQNKAKIEELQTQHKMQQQIRENELLKKEKELNEELIRKQNYFIYAVVTCLIIAMILTIVYYKFNKARRKANKQLQQLNYETSAQKKEIMIQARDLKTAYEEIQTINENLEQLVVDRTRKVHEQNEKLIRYAYMNAHNLRGPLARILGLVYLMKDPKAKDEIEDFVMKLENESKDLDMVVSEMNKALEDEGIETITI